MYTYTYGVTTIVGISYPVDNMIPKTDNHTRSVVEQGEALERGKGRTMTVEDIYIANPTPMNSERTKL